jgi:DNA (cytosine-5)-methyltransferase 1
MTQVNALSLFSGMGGDTLGMINAGVNVQAFCEFSSTAIQSHLLNFPESTLIEDLSHKKKQDQTDIKKIKDELFEKYWSILPSSNHKQTKENRLEKCTYLY